MRKAILALIVLGALAILSVPGYRYYRGWRHARQMTMVRGFLEHTNTRSAMLALQQALKSNPNDVEACRIMAYLAEADASELAVGWRQRVLDLRPKSFNDRMAYARVLVASGDVEKAAKVLQVVATEDRKRLEYHRVTGYLATTVGDIQSAEYHLSEVVKAEPTNVVWEVSLLSMRLWSKDPAVSGAARERLAVLRGRGGVAGTDALRHLALDAVRRQDARAALDLTAELVAPANVSFADRLLRLDVLQRFGKEAFPKYLAELQASSAENLLQSANLARWLIQHGDAAGAIRWVQRLPMAWQTNQPLGLVMVDALASESAWKRVLEVVDTFDWSRMEVVRFLQRTRALKALGMDGAAKTEWSQAMLAAGGDLENLSALYRNASAWSWLGEQDEVLWAIVNRYPGERWARQKLQTRLAAAGQTRSLQTLFNFAVQADPLDLDAKNNFANTALLLGAEDERPHELAAQVYQAAPTNAFYASTYALSLQKKQRPSEALKVFERMESSTLTIPEIAAGYGVLLESMGDKTKAKKFLALAERAVLLPEERRLVDQAKSRL